MGLAAFPPQSCIVQGVQSWWGISELSHYYFCMCCGGWGSGPPCLPYLQAARRAPPPPRGTRSSVPLHCKDQQPAALWDALGEREIMCWITNHSPSVANLCCREMELKWADMINQMLFKELRLQEQTEARNHLSLKQQTMIIITLGFFLFTRFVDTFASPFSDSNTKD